MAPQLFYRIGAWGALILVASVVVVAVLVVVTR